MNSSLCVVNTQINDYVDYINLKKNSFNIVSTKFNIKEALNEIFSDKIRLQQIIRNIVSNALNFTKTSIEIEVS